MKIIVIIFVITMIIRESLSGGVTSKPTDEDLVIHGQATDILSKFSTDVLEFLQDLSDHLNDIARNRDNQDFKKLNGRALNTKDVLKSATKQRLEIAFQQLLEDLTGLVGVEYNDALNILNGSEVLSKSISRIKEFLQTAKLIFDSANNVVDGKNDEFIIHIMNTNQAEKVHFNLSGC